jgi:endonuclease YncB( thermonuclease family)
MVKIRTKKSMRKNDKGKAIPQADRFSCWETNTPYFYRAYIKEEDREKAVYDGDTIKNVNIMLGFGIEWKIPSIRLIGINAPEMRGVDKLSGEVSRKFLEKFLSDAGWEFHVKSYRFETEKFGRYMFEVFVDEKNLNFEMVKASMAKVNFYDGTT